MRDTDYAYCVARLRAVEGTLLKKEDYSKLISCTSIDNAEKILLEKQWIENPSEDISDYLFYQKEKLWRLLSESVPDKKELDILCVLNDYFNIKAAVKCLVTGASPQKYFVMPTTLDLKLIKDRLNERNFTVLFSNKGETAKNAYETAVKSENGQSAEIIIDKAAIDSMSLFAEKSTNNTLSEINIFFCDSANIKIAFRCALTKKDKTFADEAIGKCCRISRERLIEEALNGFDSLYEYLLTTEYKDGAEAFAKSGAAYEKWCDEKIIEISSQSKFTAFSFSPVCSFYYKKLTEIKNVGIILTALKSGADTKSIMERLGGVSV